MGISGRMTEVSATVKAKRKNIKPFKSIVDKQNYIYMN
jgi:hypothetical protein